jgi:DNA invertase Pin-like site-specific DNA recombinase
MIKYIAYCRKSTDEKERQVLSIDQQIAEVKEFAKRENLEIADILTEARTAKIPGRPVFNQLINLIEKGEINGIISWNPDRLARNSMDGGKIIYLLDLGKLQSLKFPTHWFENTPQGRFMLSIAFGQAKYYVDSLSQNVHRGLAYKIKQGVWPALAPWGYRNDRNTHGIVLYPPEAKVIKAAFELYATGKYTLHDMCVYFYENGVRERNSGDPPETGTVRDVFKRPFYYGYMLFKGELYKGTHEPIITKETYDKVQEIIKQRGWFHSKLYRAARYNFAFTGLIKCGYCGCAITAEHRPFYFPRTNHHAHYLYYHCTKKKLPCLQKGYTREEVIEKQMRELIQSVSLSQNWVDKMLEFLAADEQTEKQNAKTELQNLTIELSDLDQKLNRLLEAYLDTLIDSENYKQKKNELTEDKCRIENRIDQLKDGNLIWVERMKEFIFCAQECAKIARAENNGHDLKIMAQKVGSKYFLKDHKIEFSLLPPFQLLAAPAPAASREFESDRILRLYQEVRNHFKSQR